MMAHAQDLRPRRRSSLVGAAAKGAPRDATGFTKWGAASIAMASAGFLMILGVNWAIRDYGSYGYGYGLNQALHPHPHLPQLKYFAQLEGKV